jgi:hypothetical protein
MDVMEPIIWIIILVFALLLAGLLLLMAVAIRRTNSDADISGQEIRPQGYYVSLGISIGAGFGVALGLVFDNLALGIAIGAAIGASIGGILEQRNKNKVRPLTGSEERFGNRGVMVGVVLALLGVVVLLGLILLLIR